MHGVRLRSCTTLNLVIDEILVILNITVDVVDMTESDILYYADDMILISDSEGNLQMPVQQNRTSLYENIWYSTF